MKCMKARPYLLDALITGREADHARNCPACGRIFERMKKIHHQIIELPLTDAVAPPSLAQNNKGNLIFAPLRVIQWFFVASSFSRWIPTFRSFSMKNGGIEGLVTAGIVVMALALVPKLRDLQDSQLQRRLQAYLPNFLVTDRNHSLSENLGSNEAERSIASISSETEIDDFADEAVEAELERTGKTEKLIAKSQAWRFNLKTDNPGEIRRKIVHFLTIQLNADTGGNATGKTENVAKEIKGSVKGVVVPGGIQFDLLVPHEKVLVLKEYLEKLSTKSSEPESQKGEASNSPQVSPSSAENGSPVRLGYQGKEISSSVQTDRLGKNQFNSSELKELGAGEFNSLRDSTPERSVASGAAGKLSSSPNVMSEGFTWYRNRSKRELPQGYSRVVIWLSQI